MTRFYSSTAQPTTLSAGCTNSATSIQVTATTGFPAAEFILALDYGTAQQELVKVTAVAGTTLTVVRGFDSTTAQAHSLGAAVRHVHSADDFRLSRTHEAASSGVHGATGALVGTTDAQALSNKDLTAGTNTFPASLATLTGAQALTNKNLSDASNTFPASLATDAEVTTAVGNHAALTATHGVAGALVGTTDTQTLTNKTLASPLFSGDYVGRPVHLEKSVDETLANSTAFQDDDILQFSAVANAVYRIDYAVRFTRTVNTCGRKYQFVGPAGATGGVPTVTALTAPFASGNQVPDSGSGGGTDSADETISGSLRVKTAGTAGLVSLQWAQNTSNASALVCKAGSYMIVTRVA